MSHPAAIGEFIGNEHVVEILRRAVAWNRLPHAMIFAGPDGVGKRTLGHLLAQLLNCHSPSKGEVCGVCLSCRKITARVHPDVLEVAPDGQYIKIGQIRELIGEIAYQPFEGKCRVVLLDGAERMRQETANCMLKTLEEPPSRTFLILLTGNPYALLGTIRSRCRMIQFGRIPQRHIEKNLKEKRGFDPEAARRAAACGNGSLGAAASFDAERDAEMRDRALEFARVLLAGESFFEASTLAASLAKDKEEYEDWLDVLELLLMEAYVSRFAPERFSPTENVGGPGRLESPASAERLARAIEAVKALRRARSYNLNRQIALEAVFLRMRRRETSAGE